MHCLKYLHNRYSVLGCFLDASKAFDMVDQGRLFTILEIPSPIIRFLLYSRDKSSSISRFQCIYCGLIEELSNRGVGCYWGF